MAGTLLHITLALETLKRVNLDSKTIATINANLADFRLGAVLADLPYYDKLWLSGYRSIVGSEIQYADAGNQIHAKSSNALALSLMKNANQNSECVTALGFLTHMAVDIIFHQEIERRVATNPVSSMGPSQHHKFIEDQMDLFVHHDFLGHAGIGSKYTRKALVIKPHSSWASFASRTLTMANGIHITAAKLRNCLNGLAAFAFLYSIPNAPWIKTTPKSNPNTQKTALLLAEQSIQLSQKYLEIGTGYLSGAISQKAFKEAIPSKSMANGTLLY